MTKRTRGVATALLLAAIMATVSASPAMAASREELESEASQALRKLTSSNTAARLLNQ